MRRPAVLLLVGSLPAGAGATTVDHLTWEQQLERADLVGIVECETAGGIVARYRIVEAWKGPPAGRLVAIRQWPNAWHAQYPLALVGERWLVAAARGETPPEEFPVADGPGLPQFWRQFPATFHLPPLQGAVRLPPDGPGLAALGAGRKVGLEEFRAAALTFLASPPSRREARVLAAVARRHGIIDRLGDPLPVEGRAAAEALLAAATGSDGEERGRIRVVLAEAGGAETLALLADSRARFPGTAAEREEVVESIRRRLERHPLRATRTTRPAGPPPPGEAERAALERALAVGPDVEGFAEAFDALTLHDPDAVARWLRRWSNRVEEWYDVLQPWVLGASFAWRCRGDRRAHLAGLLEAREPLVRVAAAVWLAFEDEPAALPALRRHLSLAGDAGAWASLALARRGERAAVPRLLQVLADDPFAPDGEPVRFDILHHTLGRRLEELLSNSARASGLPQPWVRGDGDCVEPAAEADDRHRRYTEWWLAHQHEVRLHDPWLADLARRRVD